jgi:hypothetical protein
MTKQVDTDWIVEAVARIDRRFERSGRTLPDDARTRLICALHELCNDGLSQGRIRSREALLDMVDRLVDDTCRSLDATDEALYAVLRNARHDLRAEDPERFRRYFGFRASAEERARVVTFYKEIGLVTSDMRLLRLMKRLQPRDDTFDIVAPDHLERSGKRCMLYTCIAMTVLFLGTIMVHGTDLAAARGMIAGEIALIVLFKLSIVLLIRPVEMRRSVELVRRRRREPLA